MEELFRKAWTLQDQEKGNSAEGGCPPHWERSTQKIKSAGGQLDPSFKRK